MLIDSNRPMTRTKLPSAGHHRADRLRAAPRVARIRPRPGNSVLIDDAGTRELHEFALAAARSC
ncbi:hypothetical protein H7X46_14815 [Pseudonocardia sp. C8]|uniref:hypothetical protein n=1 Tax=Pseudonocardia sp. C8 TaxID=2762759 RepID=UPI001642D51F|nr:hypothetical protein [Pseudonocardia sp. C8]MBC3192335.1 hypothetical protein [Pseudonocardia sp. C8]